MSEDLDLNDEVLEFLRDGELAEEEERLEGSLNSTNGTFSNRVEYNEDFSEEAGDVGGLAVLSPVVDPEEFFNIFVGTALEGVISVLDLILHFTLNSYPPWVRQGMHSTMSNFSEMIPIRAQCQRNIVVLKCSFPAGFGAFELNVRGRCNGGVIFGKHELDWHLWTLRVIPEHHGFVECESSYGVRRLPLLDYIFENVVICYRDPEKTRNFLAACLVAVERYKPENRIMLCNRLWAIFPGLWGQIEAAGKMVRFHQVTLDDYYKHTFAKDGWIEDPGIKSSTESDLKRDESKKTSSDTVELKITDKVRFEDLKNEALDAPEQTSVTVP